MKTRHTLLNALFVIALAVGSVSIAMPAQAVSPDVVISQVYGGGGNTSAPYPALVK